MKTKETKQPLYLVVAQERRNHGDDYFVLAGRIVTERYEHGEWTPYGCDDDYGDGLLFAGLRVRCQGDDRSKKFDRNWVYGFDCSYHETFTVDLRKGKRMVKTLEYVERKLAKMADARGYVQSFGDYVGRMAEVFGCSGIAVEKDQASRVRTGRQYDRMSIGDGVNRVNHLIFTWKEGDGTPIAEVA